MDASHERLLALKDEAIPALPAILGPEAPAMLAAAVEPQGGRIDAARLSQVSWLPGHSLGAVFQTRVSWSAGGQPTDEHIVVSAGRGEIQGALQLEDEQGERVSVWRLAQDPALPGLAVAMDPKRARTLLDSLGVAPGPVSVQLRAYRPGRRAVVEVRTQRQRIFVKVVPPARIAGLQALHAHLAEHLPVPRSHGWSEQHGLIVLQALPGVSLRQCLLEGKQTPPDPAELSRLLDAVPQPLDPRPAISQADIAIQLAPLVRKLLPEETALIDQLLEAFAADRPSRPDVPVHGDLHEAQLTVQQGHFTGLLDIDTTGLGERIDDWAAMLGHLAVLGEAVPAAQRRRVRVYAGRVLALADRETADPGRLRTRTAAVIFGLASGPFRVQAAGWLEETRRRLKLAQSWLRAASTEAEHENVLRQV